MISLTKIPLLVYVAFVGVIYFAFGEWGIVTVSAILLLIAKA